MKYLSILIYIPTHQTSHTHIYIFTSASTMYLNDDICKVLKRRPTVILNNKGMETHSINTSQSEFRSHDVSVFIIN